MKPLPDPTRVQPSAVCPAGLKAYTGSRCRSPGAGRWGYRLTANTKGPGNPTPHAETHRKLAVNREDQLDGARGLLVTSI